MKTPKVICGSTDLEFLVVSVSAFMGKHMVSSIRAVYWRNYLQDLKEAIIILYTWN